MIRQIGSDTIDIELGESVNFIQVKETFTENPTIDFYKKMYPIEVKKKSSFSIRRSESVVRNIIQIMTVILNTR